MRRKANEKMYKKQINGKYGIEKKVEAEITKVGGGRVEVVCLKQGQ